MQTAMQVYVLLFNPDTDNEGIHTIKMGASDLILMFEEEDDALRYAGLLEAQDFPVPSVVAVDREEIEEFCRGEGYECKLVPAGFVPQTELDRLLLVPPESNVDSLYWQDGDGERPSEAPPAENEGSDDRTMSDTELDRIRRQLEGLI
jgi:hypothetical protein